MDAPVVFELRLQGDDVSPDSTPLDVLGEFLVQAAKALRSMVPSPDGKPVLVSLTGIRKGSNVLQFTSSAPHIVEPAVDNLACSMKSRDLRSLPPPAQAFVRKMIDFAQSHPNGSVAVARKPGDPPLAVVRSDFDKELHAPTIRGETVLTGILMRVGGVKPRFAFETESGLVFCDASIALAKQLGSRLYEVLAIRGVAEWDSASRAVVSFRAEEVLPYRHTPLTEAFDALRHASGEDAWADVDDVVGMIEEMRREVLQ